MSDIQKARDVLAGWRNQALPGPWSKEPDTDWEGVAQAAITTGNGALTWDDHGGDVFSPGTARLIVGTAGNPESLDADDALLALALEYGDLPSGNGSRFIALAKRKAAAIIAADERMSA